MIIRYIQAPYLCKNALLMYGCLNSEPDQIS